MSRNIYEAERLQKLNEGAFDRLRSIIDDADDLIKMLKREKYPTRFTKEIEKARDQLLRMLTQLS